MSTPSTRNLKGLPTVDRLCGLLQSLAMLDAIMSPDWEDRYFSFDAAWSKKQQMGSMRNGSGDGFFALFNRKGCFLKGFVHDALMTPYRTEPPMLWPGLLEGLPAAFAAAAEEPAFSMEATTFCLWRMQADSSWSRGPIEFPRGKDPDGSEYLLQMLDGDPKSYRRHAADYFEAKLPLKAIRHVYDQLPLTKKIVSALNPAARRKSLARDAAEIGYPA